MLKPKKLANKHFLSSFDLSADEIIHILELAKNFKNKKLNVDFNKKVLGLILISHQLVPELVSRWQCQDLEAPQLT